MFLAVLFRRTNGIIFDIMYCPQCGQERTSQATSFCSRCGFLLTGTAELLLAGGAFPQPRRNSSNRRRRGVKQGLFIFLLTFLVAPIVGLFVTFGLRMEPWPVGVVVAIFGVGGLLRIAHALMFGEKEGSEPPAARALQMVDAGLSSAPETVTLPRLNIGTSDYVSPIQPTPRLDTNDLEPRSVTESTTKLLEKDRPA
jgi:hypothetical protein